MGGKYAIQFGLMSAAATAAAIFSARDWGLRAGLFWTATALAIVAYATNRPGLLMKRPDGSRPAWAWVVLGPYFLLAGLSLWLYRRSARRRIAVAEVRPGVWFARRLTAKELRHAGVNWSAVLDLAAEFPRVAVRDAQYRSLPVLDGTVPTQRQLRDAVDWIDERARGGNVLVHCALGHGRTGTVVIAWLLSRGHCPDARSAAADLRARRPTFGLSAEQLAVAGRVMAGSPAAATPPLDKASIDSAR